MRKCGYCATHLQSVWALANYETLLLKENNIAIQIDRDSGKIISYHIKIENNNYIVGNTVEVNINLVDLCGCNVLC